MYCPNCKAEFRTGYTECVQCGVALVDELPPGPLPEYLDLTTVLVAPSQEVLMVAKSRLEAEGISCFTTNNLADLIGGGRFAGYSLALGPQELQVSPEDAERAKEVLAEIVPQEAEEE